MATNSGTEFRVLLSTDGTTYKGFANETECSFEITSDTRETTSKDSATWRTYVPNARTWTASGTAIFGDDDASKWNPDDLYTLVGTTVTIKLTPCAAGSVTPVLGESALTGFAVFTSFSSSQPDKDNGTFTFSLQGAGELVKTTNA
jgi:predicted secreted protein